MDNKIVDIWFNKYMSDSQVPVTYLVVVLLLGSVVGFFANQTLLSTSAPVCSPECISKEGELVKVVEEQKLPLISELLTNPIFYEWWASAEGTVVKKTEDSITLEKDGNQVVIKVRPTVTKFFIQVSEIGQPASASFEDVKIGSKLRGGVLMSRIGTLGLAGEENVAIATSFVILE